MHQTKKEVLVVHRSSVRWRKSISDIGILLKLLFTLVELFSMYMFASYTFSISTCCIKMCKGFLYNFLIILPFSYILFFTAKILKSPAILLETQLNLFLSLLHKHLDACSTYLGIVVRCKLQKNT